MVAVLTGDIIASKKIEERAQLNEVLKESFYIVEHKVLKRRGSLEIYRGDSFQGIIENPEKALLAAILIRARLRAWNYTDPHDAKPLQTLPDARMSIGIGAVSYKGDKVVESDGEAFQYSGQLLDTMKQAGSELAIRTPWEDVNDELEVVCKLLDAIIGRWSSAMAEATCLYLQDEVTQQELSAKLKISQPAVHKRLASANIDAVVAALNRFQKLITKKLK
ncbi:SatD family protein [Fulvivirga ulvae]|uniref:SatD family protein n=1 Tax=Fulvivirga ulvae TaxID=2904245 RepID=UPI001F25231B|nr:SatD family protein [Fulvivirga ulvae]UII31438.1 SatD family protein [Fulvivirga ulvae]